MFSQVSKSVYWGFTFGRHIELIISSWSVSPSMWATYVFPVNFVKSPDVMAVNINNVGESCSCVLKHWERLSFWTTGKTLILGLSCYSKIWFTIIKKWKLFYNVCITSVEAFYFGNWNSYVSWVLGCKTSDKGISRKSGWGISSTARSEQLATSWFNVLNFTFSDIVCITELLKTVFSCI